MQCSCLTCDRLSAPARAQERTSGVSSPAEEEDVQENARALAAKLQVYGGLCWWCHLFAHEPNTCPAKKQPSMKHFKQFRSLDTESAAEGTSTCLCKGCTGQPSVSQKKLSLRVQGEHTQAYNTSYSKQRRDLELSAQASALQDAESALIPPKGNGPLGAFTIYQLLTLEFALDLVNHLNEEQRMRAPGALNHAALQIFAEALAPVFASTKAARLPCDATVSNFVHLRRQALHHEEEVRKLLRFSCAQEVLKQKRLSHLPKDTSFLHLLCNRN